MNSAEMKKVLYAASLADGGCAHCMGAVVGELMEQMPDYGWLDVMDDMIRNDIGKDDADYPWRTAYEELNAE